MTAKHNINIKNNQLQIIKHTIILHLEEIENSINNGTNYGPYFINNGKVSWNIIANKEEFAVQLRNIETKNTVTLDLDSYNNLEKSSYEDYSSYTTIYLSTLSAIFVTDFIKYLSLFFITPPPVGFPLVPALLLTSWSSIITNGRLATQFGIFFGLVALDAISFAVAVSEVYKMIKSYYNSHNEEFHKGEYNITYESALQLIFTEGDQPHNGVDIVCKFSEDKIIECKEADYCDAQQYCEEF